MSREEDQLQKLRSRATELLLREEWRESVHVYTQIITLCQADQISTSQSNPDPDHQSKIQKHLCLAYSNRAESLCRLRDFAKALEDCDRALEIESNHFKTLLCKGKILLGLNRYSMSMECFRSAQSHSQAGGCSESLNGYLEKCKKLEFQSRTGSFDLSDWVTNGFCGKLPDLAEYIGPVQIRRSEISGRGLFATKNIDSGTLLVVTKAIATERAILSTDGSGENEQLVMWKNFIGKVSDCASKCPRTLGLISTLSSGEDEDRLVVPEMGLFRPENEESEGGLSKNLDTAMERNRILSILDVNSLVEEAFSSKVLGKNRGYHGVGLWLMASFINHSCNPNARRLHVGDFAIFHTSRDVKAGEEITSAYFEVLSPPSKRKELSLNWGFCCNCKRCRFEEKVWADDETGGEIEMGLERGADAGSVVCRLEELMRKLVVRGKEKGFLRASFWKAYSEAYSSEKVMKRWGRRVPAAEVVVDSVAEAVGSDERPVRVVVERLKKSGGGGGLVQMDRVLSLGRGLYGKVVKKQALKTLLQIGH